jgi:hypothetical protein
MAQDYCVLAKILKLMLEGYIKSVQCTENFSYELSIFPRTEGNQGKP